MTYVRTVTAETDLANVGRKAESHRHQTITQTNTHAGAW